MLEVRTSLVGRFSCEVHRVDARLEGGWQAFALKRPRPGAPSEELAEERRFHASCAAPLPHSPRYVGFLPALDSLVFDFVDDLEPFDFIAGPTDGHAEAAIDALAALHTAPIPAGLDWLPSFGDTVYVDAVAREYDSAWPRRRALLDSLDDRFTAMGDRLVGRLAPLLAKLAEPRALLHGDAHLENLPRRTSGDVCLLDWQNPLVADPGFDVADLLAMSFPIDDRRRVEAQLVSRHAQCSGRPLSDAWRSYTLGLLQRVVRVVRLADRKPEWADSSLPLVFRRCAAAAMDHLGDVVS